MTSDLSYFPRIYDIWTEYENKKIGLEKRNRLLEPHRINLYQSRKGSSAQPTNIPQINKQPKMTHDGLARLTADWYGVPVEEIE